MYRNGHYGAALLFVAPIGTILVAMSHVELALLAGADALALAVVPDLDHRVPFITHRGPTHTVWFALLVGVTLAGGSALVIAATAMTVLMGFVVGAGTIVSHIAADALTPAGVRPWSPLDDTHYSFDIVRAKNPLANYALLGLGIAVTVGAVWVGSALGSL
jgi:inner membrane protein